MKLPNPFRRAEVPRRGMSVPRGSISYQGDGLADRLHALGIRVHDPLADAHATGALGRLQRGDGAASHPDDVHTDDLPPGSKVTRAPSVVERMQGGDDGTVWNGPPEKPAPTRARFRKDKR